MIIRDIVEADLKQICLIEQETFSDPWTEKDFKEAASAPSNEYLVAEIDGEIVGYCGLWGIAGEGYIYNVAVKKEFRKQGIGYKMLHRLIKQAEAKGIGSFTLEVRATNVPAIKLYEALGFEQAGIRKDFYTKPKEDAVIMWRRPIQ